MPHGTAHPTPCQAIPSRVAPETPALAPTPPSLHLRLREDFSRPWLPPGPAQASSRTPPCSPQTFLSLLLSLWREQRSLPARPAAWLSRGVSPHPHGQEGRFGSGDGNLGQPGPPLCQGPGFWGRRRRDIGLAHRSSGVVTGSGHPKRAYPKPGLCPLPTSPGAPSPYKTPGGLLKEEVSAENERP